MENVFVFVFPFFFHFLTLLWWKYKDLGSLQMVTIKTNSNVFASQKAFAKDFDSLAQGVK